MPNAHLDDRHDPAGPRRRHWAAESPKGSTRRGFAHAGFERSGLFHAHDVRMAKRRELRAAPTSLQVRPWRDRPIGDDQGRAVAAALIKVSVPQGLKILFQRRQIQPARKPDVSGAYHEADVRIAVLCEHGNTVLVLVPVFHDVRLLLDIV